MASSRRRGSTPRSAVLRRSGRPPWTHHRSGFPQGSFASRRRDARGSCPRTHGVTIGTIRQAPPTALLLGETAAGHRSKAAGPPAQTERSCGLRMSWDEDLIPLKTSTKCRSRRVSRVLFHLSLAVRARRQVSSLRVLPRLVGGAGAAPSDRWRRRMASHRPVRCTAIVGRSERVPCLKSVAEPRVRVPVLLPPRTPGWHGWPRDHRRIAGVCIRM
jgi:hypothetical protein